MRKSDRARVRAILSSLHGRRKAAYIWEYFHFYIIAAAVLAGLIIVTLLQTSAMKSTYAQLIVLNAPDPESCSAGLEEDLQEAGIPGSGGKAAVEAGLKYDPLHPESSSAEDLQVVAAELMTGEADLLAGSQSVFDTYAASGGLMDLSSALGTAIQADSGSVYYAKDASGKEIAAGIWCGSDSPLMQSACSSGKMLIGIAANSSRQEAAVRIMQYLLR